MGGEVSRFSANMIKLIWSSTQILQFLLKPCPQVDAIYVLVSIPPSAPLSATNSPFLLMTNQNQTNPAPHPQNQPPDSGSVYGSQRQQLWLSLHRSHRVRFCVSSVFCLPSKERSGSIDLSRRIKIFVTATILNSWAKILPREHIFSGHLKILEDFCTRCCSHNTGFYGNKILNKNLDLTQDFPNKILFRFLCEQNLVQKSSKIFKWPDVFSWQNLSSRF